MTELFADILNMSMTASVVILLVLFVRFLLRRAPKIYAYALWSVVLFRLLCPVSLSAPVSLLTWLQPEVRESSAVTSTVTYLSAGTVAEAAPETPVTPQESRQENGEIPRQELARQPVSLLKIASWVWVTGAAGMMLHSLWQYLCLRRRLVGATVYRGDVYLADHIETPFVLGLLMPRVYLPVSLPHKERRFVIAHERHHIRRGDHIIKLLAYIALCIHWFNPLVWVAFVLAGKDMEMSCDEAVIKRYGPQIRADYSQTLLRLSTGKRVIAGSHLAFGEGDTKGRIRNMADWKKPKLWLSILCAAVCLAVLVACVLNPEQEDPLADMTETPGPASVSYGDLNFTIPEGYQVASREMDTAVDHGVDWRYELIISNDKGIVGGITLWQVPEQPYPVGIGIMEWIRSLGLPEAQENPDVPIGYMASNSIYGDYEAEIFNELDPASLNVEHHFYIREDYVYDFWFDQNLVTDGQFAGILETVYFVGETPPQLSATPPDEPDPAAELALCRSVLELVQSGSYWIESQKINDGTEALNEKSNTAYFCHNGNWLSITQVPEYGMADGNGVPVSKHAYMSYNGTFYSNEADGRLDEKNNVIWAPSQSVQVRIPWLANFRWREDVVAYMGTMPEGEGKCVMLRIDEPHPFGEDNENHYFVNFYFDAEGKFINVQLEVNLFLDNAYREYESIATLDAAIVETEINREYSRASGVAVTAPEHYRKTFQSDDGTVTVNFDVTFVREALEGESRLGIYEILDIAEREFRATSVDGYGLDTTGMGYEGVTCELNITEIRVGDSYLISATESVPTIEIWGERIYTFANGDRLGQEQGAIKLMLIKAANGEILIRFGKKD